MKPITTLLAFTLVIGLAFAYKVEYQVSRGHNPHDDTEIGCFVEGKFVGINKTRHYANEHFMCGSYFCREDFIIEEEICPTIYAQNKTCMVIIDLFANYPDCCPKVVYK